MHITSSIFVKSLTHAKNAPSDKPSFAMIGRSNVGKSSLINRLLNRKNLARTSAMPGKTQLINYFLVNDTWYLVDLPGYGWAKVSKAHRTQWEKMMKAYLSQAQLTTIFVLLDSRHPLQAIDLTFLEWIIQAKRSYALVLTKADKCKKKITTHIRQLQQALHARNWPLPPLFVTSAKEVQRVDPTAIRKGESMQGYMEVLAYIEELLAQE